MKLLGAILAGGKSSRFGSDKAIALVGGLTLIDHIVMGMYCSTDDLVIVGRDWRDFDAISDGDFAGEGPLAGLLAALRHGKANGYDAVLTAPCDALPMPDLKALAGDGAGVFEGHWLFGFWPVGLAATLADHLASQPDRSVHLWLDICGARRVQASVPLYNFNTGSDIRAYEATLEQHA
jgi:molybdenum cofactor guanylyltransferase